MRTFPTRLLLSTIDPPTAREARDAFAVLYPYALAFLLVGLALAATLAMQQVFVGRPSLFPFFGAVVAAAWLGGRGPGYFAAAVSIPLSLYFYSAAEPAERFYAGDIIFFLFFVLSAFVGGAMNSRRRQTEEVLHKAHRQLQTKAAELQGANDALVAEIAEHRRTEAALERTRSELDRAGRLTSMAELAASIAHEINQPLTAAVTNADTCVRWLNAPEPDLAEAREAAARVVRNADRAGQVVARVRSMVRKALTEPTQISVRTSLDEVLALLQSDIAKHRVTVRTAIASDIPRFRGDRIQIQQVFVNLITNALDSLAQTNGRPRELSIAARREQPQSVTITVRDNGEGFSDGSPDRLFESFVTTKPGGLGMGLSICRTIVEAHGGTLSAAAAAPHGAEFRITLPLDGEAP